MVKTLVAVYRGLLYAPNTKPALDFHLLLLLLHTNDDPIPLLPLAIATDRLPRAIQSLTPQSTTYDGEGGCHPPPRWVYDDGTGPSLSHAGFTR